MVVAVVLFAIVYALREKLQSASNAQHALLGEWHVSSEVLAGRLVLNPDSTYTLLLEPMGFPFASFESKGTSVVQRDKVVLRPASGDAIYLRPLEESSKLEWTGELGRGEFATYARDLAMKKLEFVRP